MKNIWINPSVPYSIKSVLFSLILFVPASFIVILQEAGALSIDYEMHTYIELSYYLGISWLITSGIILLIGLILNQKLSYSQKDDVITFREHSFKLSNIAKIRICSITKKQSISTSSSRAVSNTYYKLVITYFLEDYSETDKQEYRKLCDDTPDEISISTSHSSRNKKAKIENTHSISLGNTRFLSFISEQAYHLGSLVNVPVKKILCR